MPDPKNKKTFEQAYKMAEEAGAKFPSIVAAQFGLETAWGTKTAGAKNNLFNLKYHEPTAKKMRAMGLKVKKSPKAVLDKATGSMDHYMEFESEEDAFKGYMTFLKVNPRYEKALKATTPEEYITELKNAGYAEDPKYIGKILNISKQADDIIPSTANGKINKKNSIKKQKEVISKYKKEVLKINETHKLSEGNRKSAIDALNKEYYKRGFIITGNDGKAAGIINENIKKINKEKETAFNEKKQDFKLMYEMLGKTDILYNPDKDDETKQKISSMSMTAFTSDEAKKYSEIVKKYPEFFKKGSNGTIRISKEKFLPYIEEEYKKYTYEDLDLIGDDGFTRGKDLSLDVNALKTGMAKLGSGSYSATASLEKLYNESGSKGFIPEEDGESFIIVNPDWDNEIKKEKEVIENKKTTPKNKTIESTESENYSDDWFNLTPERQTPNTYDASQQKDIFPYVEVGGALAGALTGLISASKDTPRRDEELNNAFVAYTHDLKRLSQIGLDPEEEAYAKQMLSESYSTGVESLTRTSGGNRNIVLANLGRLDAQKQQGLSQIALADAKAKRESLYKYGEAMKYVAEFDANKDIANNERDYKEALLDKQAGAELAAAGFTKLLDEFTYYRENAPGSAMSIAKSIYFQDNLGFDPNMKDDGTGEPGTKSAYDMKQAEINSKITSAENDRDIWNNLTPDKKAVVDAFNKENGFGNRSSEILQWVNKQSVAPQGKINLKKLDSTTPDNYGAIFEESKAFSSYTDPLSTSATPFQNTFDKEKDKEIQQGLTDFNPFENPFDAQKKEDLFQSQNQESVFDTQLWKDNNYVNKQ